MSDVEEYDPHQDAAAMAWLAGEKAREASAEETARTLKGLLRTSLATEKRLEAALAVSVEKHTKEMSELQADVQDKERHLVHQVIEAEAAVERLRSSMREQEAAEPHQAELEVRPRNAEYHLGFSLPNTQTKTSPNHGLYPQRG
mmetsp:Transcript_15668/g.39379  ORF Transcript_15668/g.39379 Transcript_15668/m.39379 type:complete len:144 (+) Transcript_15668:130-561(+)